MALREQNCAWFESVLSGSITVRDVIVWFFTSPAAQKQFVGMLPHLGNAVGVLFLHHRTPERGQKSEIRMVAAPATSSSPSIGIRERAMTQVI
jgi:hypothetical protein